MTALNTTRSNSFSCKKWSLFLIMLAICGVILLMIIGVCIVLDESGLFGDKVRGIAVTIGTGFILLVIQFIGFTGALKEHYTCMLVYSILMAIIMCFLVAISIFLSFYWLCTGAVALITGLSISYARDLRWLKFGQPYDLPEQVNHGYNGFLYPNQTQNCNHGLNQGPAIPPPPFHGQDYNQNQIQYIAPGVFQYSNAPPPYSNETQVKSQEQQ